MRYRITAKVQGHVEITESLSIERTPYRFDFEKSGLSVPGEWGVLGQVAVSVSVPDEQRDNFRNKVGPGTGLSKATLEVGGDHELRSKLVAQLQSLEAHLAFGSAGALSRILWEEPEEEFIPENKEDS